MPAYAAVGLDAMRQRDGAPERLRAAIERAGTVNVPGGDAQADAAAFVSALRRTGDVVPTLEREREAMGSHDPTDTSSTATPFAHFEMALTELLVRYRAARAAAHRAGIKNCGGLEDTPVAPSVLGGSPNEINLPAPASADEAVFDRGRKVATQSGCLACHRIGEDGNDGPGPDLTRVGVRLSAQQLESALVDPVAPMPSFRQLPADQREALVAFLGELR